MEVLARMQSPSGGLRRRLSREGTEGICAHLGVGSTCHIPFYSTLKESSLKPREGPSSPQSPDLWLPASIVENKVLLLISYPVIWNTSWTYYNQVTSIIDSFISSNILWKGQETWLSSQDGLPIGNRFPGPNRGPGFISQQCNSSSRVSLTVFRQMQAPGMYVVCIWTCR